MGTRMDEQNPWYPGCCHLANSMACHPRATCHIARCNNSIRHIENRFSPYFTFFCYLKSSLGFDERRLSYRLRYTCIGIGKYLGCVKIFPLGASGGRRTLNVNLGSPIISETTRARKLKLKTQLDVVKVFAWGTKFFR